MWQQRTTIFRLRLMPAIPLILANSLLLAACSDRREQTATLPTPQTTPSAPTTNIQTAQTPQSVSPSATPASAPPPTPQAAEVADKLARIFQGAVQPDTSRKSGALAGDFNGDGSEDLALVVKSSPDKLEEINSEVANWILLDPHNIILPDPNRGVQKLPPPIRVRIETGDTLLAVIHGYGAKGWRDTAAQQAFLLKNVAGRDLKVERKQDAVQEFKALAPHIGGDIIRGDFDRTPGLLCWTGAKYAWFAATKSGGK